jgi:hypothetical protein
VAVRRSGDRETITTLLRGIWWRGEGRRGLRKGRMECGLEGWNGEGWGGEEEGGVERGGEERGVLKSVILMPSQ